MNLRQNIAIVFEILVYINTILQLLLVKFSEANLFCLTLFALVQFMTIKCGRFDELLKLNLLEVLFKKC